MAKRKQTAGGKIIRNWIKRGYERKPIGAVWYPVVHSDLQRRIDRAIRAAERRGYDRAIRHCAAASAALNEGSGS